MSDLHSTEAYNTVPLLDRPAVAERLGCSWLTVKRLEQRGELPAIRVGRLVRFRAEDVERYIATHRDPAPGEEVTDAALGR